MGKEIKIWKTITIGGKKPNLKGVEVSSYARELIDKIKFPKKKEKINLVKIRVEDLFEDNNKIHTIKEIFDKSKKMGLELCPPTTGVYLREEYQDQPVSDWFWIAMEPIVDSDGRPGVFCVGRDGDGKRWIYTNYASPVFHWLLYREFVFRSCKSLKLNSLESLPFVLEINGVKYQKIN